MSTASQPPKELTTPPEGYEWTGEFHPPQTGELFALWSNDGWYEMRAQGQYSLPCPILRRIKPEYVNVRLPRDVVKKLAEHKNEKVTFLYGINFSAVAREALEQENNE